MNLSGKAVRYWMNELKIPIDKIIVITDDLNLPFGTIRLRKNGSAGGHNGLTNIIELLGSSDFARIRLGIGNNFSQGQQIDFVLGELSEDEMKDMEDLSNDVVNGIKSISTIGVDRVMNTLNTKKTK